MERCQKQYLLQHDVSGQQVSMIAVNKSDVASYNQAKVLMDEYEWISLGYIEGKQAYKLKNTRMWLFEKGILFEDMIDKRWEKVTGEIVTEVIFPSRHSAASGKPSLTLHPIGVPHLKRGSIAKYGGKSGYSPPPSTRLSAWWKDLQNKIKSSEIKDDFQLSLEVTHHGPWIEVPALFIEIGSTKASWPSIPAAKLLAGIIADGMGFSGQEQSGIWDSKQNKGDLVLVTIGGGHYAPRANKLASLDGLWLGHMLATYSLPFDKPDLDQKITGGTWRQSLDQALNSTAAAFPNGKIICSMDKKAFRGWQRQAIRDFLSARNVPLLTTKQIIEMLNAKSQAS